MATETQASIIASILDNDGQRWVTDDGASLEELSRVFGACVLRIDDSTRFIFPDKTSILATRQGWDIALSLECSCLESQGHSERCLEARDWHEGDIIVGTPITQEGECVRCHRTVLVLPDGGTVTHFHDGGGVCNWRGKAPKKVRAFP